MYVSVMCGEYDDQLKWPFTGDMTVRMLNRSKFDNSAQNSHHTVLIIQYPFIADVSLNVVFLFAHGDIMTVSHSDLSYNATKNITYLRNDKLRLQKLS